MKRLMCLLLLLLSSVAQAAGPFFTTTPDVTIRLPGENVSRNYYADETTTTARGLVLRAALAQAPPGSCVFLSSGVYDVGPRHLYFPPKVSIKGAGRDFTILLGTGSWTGGAGGQNGPDVGACQFELNDGTVVESLTFRLQASVPLSSGVCIGFGRNQPSPVPNGSLAIIRDCVCDSRCEHTVYVWVSSKVRLVVENSTIIGGNWLVTAGGSGGTDNQDILVKNCTLYGDSSYSLVGGDTNHRLFGFACRGGRLRAFDCLVELHSTEAKTPAVRGMWTAPVGRAPTGEGGHPASLAESHNCTYRLTALKDSTTSILDVEQGGGTVRVFGGSGSGPEGVMLVGGQP